MTPGEKYRIQVNTVSYGVESNQPQEVTQTVSEYFAVCISKWYIDPSYNMVLCAV